MPRPLPLSETRLSKIRGLKFIYVLTFMLVLVVLSIYYFRLGRQIEKYSHNQVNMAFELILDDLRKRSDELKPKLEQFVRNSLGGPIYVTHLILQEIEQQEQKGTVREVRKVMPYLSSVAHEIRKLGQEIGAREILVYNAQRGLLAVYEQTSQKTFSGVYLPTISEQTIIPVEPKENWLLDLQDLKQLPQKKLPERISRVYHEKLPETLQVKIARFNGELVLEFTVPIMERENVEGLCLCYIGLSRQDTERYSRLSQTRVNLFSGSQLSVGMLPEFNTIPEENLKQLQPFDVYKSDVPPQVSYSKITIAGEHYYHGLLSLGEQQTSIGTIAVLFPRYLEERRQGEFILLTFSVTLLFGLLYKDIRRAEKIEELNRELNTRATELEDANRQLTSEICEREKMEEALQAAKETAENANRAKSRFLANMSHELRTPLNAILGYAQILSEASSLNTLQQRGLTTIYQSGEHLLNLISEILDLAKIESGRMELQERACPLFEFLGSLTEMVRIRARQKHIDFNYEYDVGLPTGIVVDTKRLREVLLNLLGNAVKLTENGRVTFRITHITHEEPPPTIDTRPQQAQGDSSFNSGQEEEHVTILFEIEDTGPGIAPESLQEIFLPFHQLSDHRASIQGTGLGLTISRTLVEMMGGEIKVCSTVGEGSTFSFILTLREATNIQQAAETPQTKIIGYAGPRRRLLAVDDTAGNRAILKDSLTPLGFQVLEAEDGAEGLRIATHVSLDLILLDLVMPKMDGFELARQIRQCEPIQDLPLIAISANVFDDVREQSLEAGCDDFITKPFQRKELLELLEHYLQLEWIYESLPPSTPEAPRTNTDLLHTLDQLPHKHRQELLQQVHRGNLKGILKELEEIETLGEQFHPFVTELRTLAQAFEIDQIMKHLSLEM